MSTPSEIKAPKPGGSSRTAPVEHDAAAAVVAEAVAIAMEAEAAHTAAAVAEIEAAVAVAAAKAALAAERARQARQFAADRAAEITAREAAQTAADVQARTDAAAAKVATAAALAVEDLLAFGSQLGAGVIAIMLAKTVAAAAEATAHEAARAAEEVAKAVAVAAADMSAVTAACDDACEFEVVAAAQALVGLTTATAQRVALSTEQHAHSAADAAREAEAALEATATATRAAKPIDPAPGRTVAPVAAAPPDSPARSQEHERANDYATFNGTLHALSGQALGDGSHGLAGLLTSVAELAAAAIPGAHGVGLTWSEEGRADVIVGTSDIIHEVSAIDSTRKEGPGTSATAACMTVRSRSLGADSSWPEFGPDAAQLGVHSVIGVPLIVEGDVLGSFSVYSHLHDGFDDHAVELAEAFAGPAARFLQNAQMLFQSQRLVGELRSALKTRAVIDQAIGIMMSRSGYSPQEAFNGLRSVSQGTNVKVHLVAERLVRDAVRRALTR